MYPLGVHLQNSHRPELLGAKKRTAGLHGTAHILRTVAEELEKEEGSGEIQVLSHPSQQPHGGQLAWSSVLKFCKCQPYSTFQNNSLP